MSEEQTDLAEIKAELMTIGIALSLIAINQVDAVDAAQRKRHEKASIKAVDFLLKQIEAR